LTGGYILDAGPGSQQGPAVNVSLLERKVLQYGNEHEGKKSSYPEYRIHYIPYPGADTYDVSIWFGKLDNAFSDSSHLYSRYFFGLFRLW